MAHVTFSQFTEQELLFLPKSIRPESVKAFYQECLELRGNKITKEKEYLRKCCFFVVESLRKRIIGNLHSQEDN